MIIHLTGSAHNIEKDISFYRRIIKVIHENDGILARDWIETTYLQRDKKVKSDELGAVTEGDLEAIGRSDIVIIDVSHHVFSQGFQAAIAINQKKPLLLISRTPIKKHAISGYKSKLLTTAEYKTEEDLDVIIKQFIVDNTIATKDLRFNMFIDRPIYNYLRSVSYESGKNKSEIIRELIEREIKKQKD
jgi:hypothetical protein